MGAYVLRRLALMIPTLLGIIILNFVLVQFAPGGPVERVISQIENAGGGGLERIGGGGSEALGQGAADGAYRGSRGIDEKHLKELEKQFGLDKPPLTQLGVMIVNYFTLDFGESFFKKERVIDLIGQKLPVSLTLGFWTLLISYLISIPLGIRKAVQDGEPFDRWTSVAIVIGYAIPQFLFAIFLIILLAGGSFWSVFPNRGLHSDGAESFGYLRYIGDYFWHITLPVLSLVIAKFATLTLLTKNSFLDEIKKQYVMTARAKGLAEGRVLYGHVFRNAMLIVIAGFPAAFILLFTTGALLIEVVFSLDGMGLLAFEAIQERDYPVIFGTLFLFSLVAMLAQLVTDISYTLIDPRIDFESRGA